MRCAPVGFELLDFSIGEPVGLELTPRIQSTHVTECEITDFTNAPLWTVFCEGAIRNTENFASCPGIWFVAWILRGVKAPIAIELPLLVSAQASPRLSIALKSPPISL